MLVPDIRLSARDGYTHAWKSGRWMMSLPNRAKSSYGVCGHDDGLQALHSYFLAEVMLLLVHVSHKSEQQHLLSQHWVRGSRCGASRFHAQSDQTGKTVKELQ